MPAWKTLFLSACCARALWPAFAEKDQRSWLYRTVKRAYGVNERVRRCKN